MATATENVTSVTELALLKVHLSAGASADPNTAPETSEPILREKKSRMPTPIRDGLLLAKNAMQDFSGNKFTYALLQPDSDDKVAEETTTGTDKNQEETIDVLIIGGWPSVDFHIGTWLPSPENQALVSTLGDSGATTRWMWHIDIRRDDVERTLHGKGTATILNNGKDGGIRLWRAIISDLEKKKSAEGLLGKLEEEEGTLSWAWRIDPGYWAEGEEDLKAGAGGDAAELVLIARSNTGGKTQERLSRVMEEIAALAAHVVDRQGVLLDT